MVKYIIFAFLFCLVACTSKNEETIGFDELAPTSKRYTDQQAADSAKALLLNERPESSPFLAIVDTLMDDSRWIKWDTVLFPDRFGPKNQEKWFTVGTKDSLVLLHYTFKDSLRTKNAFFNWIDCFGAKCKSYAVGGNIRIPKRNALLLVGAKQLILIEGNKSIDEVLIRSTIEKDPKKENWLYIVSIPKTGKTTWKRIDKGEEKPIIRNDENS